MAEEALQRMLLFMLFLQLATANNAAMYTEYLLESGSRINKVSSDRTLPLDVYCYKEKSTKFFYIWQTVWLHLDIETNNYKLYDGPDPVSVWNAYEADNFFWSFGSFFTPKSAAHSIELNASNKKCLAVYTNQNYVVFIEVENVDYRKITLFALGVFLIMSSTSLSENSLFFYAMGIILGVCASFLILIYFFSKLFPRKSIMYGSMIGGWAISVYFFQFFWKNLKSLLLIYHDYVMWYAVIMGFISFIACYKIGPPKERRNKNIISWILQGLGIISIYLSTNITEVALMISVCIIIIKYIPKWWFNIIKSCWRKRFPPKRVLLTEEQYREEGLRETAKALKELQQYCSSPECNQWRLVRKLKNPERFAKFIDSEISHVTDSEIEEYENTEFRLRKSKFRKHETPNGATSTTLNEEDFTSDDSSISPDEL